MRVLPVEFKDDKWFTETDSKLQTLFLASCSDRIALEELCGKQNVLHTAVDSFANEVKNIQDTQNRTNGFNQKKINQLTESLLLANKKIDELTKVINEHINPPVVEKKKNWIKRLFAMK